MTLAREPWSLMGKILLLSVVSASILLGGERVQIITSQVDANGSTVNATTHPTLIYQDQILSAETIAYDQNSSVVEAFGHVNAFKAGRYHVVSEYTRLNLDEETRYSKPYYVIDTNSSVWMSTDEAQGCKNEIDLSKGMLSGCNSTDPLWKIHFTSADYDTESMWMNIYNAQLYVKDVPVMYFPYFGYPTDQTRRSGLLIPTFGMSNTEGFFYQQPIYFAPKNWWDLELRPQIRTMRGAGMYGDFRFVDSLHSKGSVRMGYFKEQSDYAQKHDLAHEKHYGYNVDYRNSAFLNEWFGLNLEGESGLYVHGGGMSDVDYLNLQHGDQVNNVTANQVLSRVNSYYSEEDNYFGAYIKYSQYLNQASNAQTIQTVPSLQYHRYLKSFLGDHLLFNADTSVNNFYRTEGKSAVQGDINAPLTLQTSLFDDYLDLSYTANGSMRMIGFYGNQSASDTTSAYSQGTYGQLDHIFKVGTTLVRPYETLTHVITPEVSYSNAGNRLYSGYYKTYHDRSTECNVQSPPSWCNYYTLNEPKDNVALALNNYLFEGGKQLFIDRLSQNFAHDKQGSYYGELQNELEWQVTKALSYYNQTSYNHDRNCIAKEQNTVRYSNDSLTASTSHYYTDTLINNTPVYASYLTGDMTYKYDYNYKFFALLAYDYQVSLLKRGEIGFMYTTRCLDFGLKYVQNIRPVVTNANANDSVNDAFVYITMILKPIGGSMFNYHLTNN